MYSHITCQSQLWYMLRMCTCVPLVHVWVWFCVRGCVMPSVCQPLQPSLALKPTEGETCQWNGWVCSIEELSNSLPCQIQYLHIQRSQTTTMFSLHEAARLTEARMPLHRLCKTCSSSGVLALIHSLASIFMWALFTSSVCTQWCLFALNKCLERSYWLFQVGGCCWKL